MLQQHARKFQSNFTVATETILHSTYMDDSMGSVKNDAQGIELYKQLSGLLLEAGMYARKWLSNSAIVLEIIPMQEG